MFGISSWEELRGCGDLVSPLQDAKKRVDTACVGFLDVSRACDFLPHGIILQQLRLSDVQGRLYRFIESLLQGQFFVVRVRAQVRRKPQLEVYLRVVS